MPMTVRIEVRHDVDGSTTATIWSDNAVEDVPIPWCAMFENVAKLAVEAPVPLHALVESTIDPDG